MIFYIKDFFSKCDQIRKKLRMWSHLSQKSLMENFIFCAVLFLQENVDKICLTGSLIRLFIILYAKLWKITACSNFFRLTRSQKEVI